MMGSEYRYRQLEAWLIEGIQKKRWNKGERLPSIRSLCADKSLSKATVLHAYQRLEANGLIEARPKSGYFVCASRPDRPLPETRSPVSAPVPVSVSDVVMDVMTRGAAFDLLPERQQREDNSHVVQLLNRHIGRALRLQRGASHQYYDEPAGHVELRELIAQRYSRLNCNLTTDELCITAGCQQALFLALMATCQVGDTVAVESPGFYGVFQLLEQLGLKALEIPSSAADGLQTQVLAEALTRWKIKACVVTPAFATPSGATLKHSAREELIHLANMHDFAVIEDDIYGDLGFFTRPEPLKALDTEDRVILCSSLSKNLSRDIRIGWISAARWHGKVKHLKLVTMLASSRFVQQGVVSFFKDGAYDAHLRKQREVLRYNCDQLVNYLNEHWPSDIKLSVPEGGLALWLQLPDNLNTLAHYNEALKEGIVITPGALFSAADHYHHCIRLSFAHPITQTREAALFRLGKLFFKR
jgi:DNA-binding transcriptional MocR family regulator